MSARAKSAENNRVIIRLPDLFDTKQHIAFLGLTTVLDKEAGAKTGYGVGNTYLVAEYLDTVDGRSVVVVGLQTEDPHVELIIENW